MLLFISEVTRAKAAEEVSIHHMLLFIGSNWSIRDDIYRFQYITCYSLSLSRRIRSSMKLVSIHHMLLFIRMARRYLFREKPVSIHHMLLFIGNPLLNRSFLTGFNTSHVTLYHQVKSDILAAQSFQYITCYSLSENGLENLHLQSISFNTSHVTLYPLADWGCAIGNKFQYITCYSLSHSSDSVSWFQLLFQYITCYSLSEMLRQTPMEATRFNTSHVTLYRQRIPSYRILFFVSIHHMLLFIPRFIGFLSIHMSNNTPKPKEFQYFYQALLEILYF